MCTSLHGKNEEAAASCASLLAIPHVDYQSVGNYPSCMYNQLTNYSRPRAKDVVGGGGGGGGGA